MAPPPLYIVGAGAIGLHLAARLSAVAPVTLLAHGTRATALSRDGFELLGAEPGQFRVPVRDIRSPLPPEADVLITLKPTQLAVALPELRLRPNQAVGLCQTGLGVADLARAVRPHAAVVRLAGWPGTLLTNPRTVRIAGVFPLEIAADDPHVHPLRDRWAALLRTAGFEVQVAAGIAACEWRSSLWSLAVAGLCAALNERNGAVLDSPPLAAVSRALLDEARAVAAAEDIVLDDADIERVFTRTASLRDNRNAMLQDLLRGVATDMPFLNAEVARRAGAHGLTALVNAVVARMVEHCERRPRDESKPT